MNFAELRVVDTRGFVGQITSVEGNNASSSGGSESENRGDAGGKLHATLLVEEEKKAGKVEVVAFIVSCAG